MPFVQLIDSAKCILKSAEKKKKKKSTALLDGNATNDHTYLFFPS